MVPSYYLQKNVIKFYKLIQYSMNIIVYIYKLNINNIISSIFSEKKLYQLTYFNTKSKINDKNTSLGGIDYRQPNRSFTFKFVNTYNDISLN